MLTIVARTNVLCEYYSHPFFIKMWYYATRGESMRKCILIIAILLIVPTVVFAAKDGIKFSMTLNPGDTYKTDKFYLQGSIHSVHMPINSVIKPANTQKVVIASNKYNLLGVPKQKERVVKNAKSGTFVAFAMPKQSKGNYNYQFAAYSNAFGGNESYEVYAGFKSDTLLIDSILD